MPASGKMGIGLNPFFFYYIQLGKGNFTVKCLVHQLKIGYYFLCMLDVKDNTQGIYYYIVELIKKSGCDLTAELKTTPNTPIRSNSIDTKKLTGIINISSQTNLSHFNLFPNPFHTSTSLQYTLTTQAHVQISLFDINGRRVGEVANENELPGDYLFDINAEKYHLNPGVYILKIMLDDELVSRRLIKF